MLVENQDSRVNSEASSGRRPEKFEALLLPHLSFIRGWVRSRVPIREDAEDVIQQTLLLACRHVEQFRFDASFSTWLCRIAINVIRGRYRRPYYFRTVLAEPKTMENLGIQDASLSPLSMLQRNETRSALLGAISKLPFIYREVVELRSLQERGAAESAQLLGITLAALKSRQHRARRLLAGLVKDQGMRSMKVRTSRHSNLDTPTQELTAVRAA
jgi:RNA polymerase sigma-70 factor (ECF subfamily)